MDSAATRRPCFAVEDNGLASIAGTEAGSSENQNHHNHHNHHHHNHFFFRPLYYTVSQRRESLRNLPFSLPVSSPRSGRFYDEEQKPHFLEACFLCKKPLGHNQDIFMYRGDTPFCSEECREEQIEIDEAKEKKWNLSASMKALRKNQKKSNSTSPNKAQQVQDYPYRTGTVAAA